MADYEKAESLDEEGSESKLNRSVDVPGSDVPGSTEAEPKEDLPPTGAEALKIGATIGVAVGVAFFFYGAYLLVAGDKPLPFAFAMLIGGGANTLVSLLAMKKSRVAWSFALSLNGVAAVVFLFGAPKIRDGSEVHILIALLPCVAMSVSAVLFALAAEQFE